MSILQAIEDNIAEEEKAELEQGQEETLEESEELVDNALSGEEEEAEADEEEVEEESDEETGEEVEEEATLPDDVKNRNQAFAEMRRDNADMRERLARMEGAADARKKDEVVAKAPKDEEPDSDLDPDDWNKWNARQQDKKIEALSDQLSSQQETMAITKFHNEWDRATAASESSDDIYKGSKDFIINTRLVQLRAENPAMSEAKINQQMKQEEYTFAIQVSQAGLDPMSFIKAKAAEAGYVYQAQEQAPVKKKLNTKKVNNNKRKGASLIGDSASSNKHKIDSDALAGMSLQGKLDMTEEEWENI